MALKPNNNGVVTGTAQKDTITWINEEEWLRALTVNALGGNDIINFKKSKYRNTINGGAGDDTIYGGTNIDTIRGGIGNDQIYGGAGNDNLYGGAGINNLYFYKGDGKDLVYSTAGASDTLHFTNVNFGKLYFYKSGNNLVISGYGTDNDYLTVIGYYNGNSSIKSIQTKDRKISVANAIKQSAQIHKNEPDGRHIIGTNGNDNLYGTAKNDIIHGKLGADKIYGYGGNDVLESFIDAYINGGEGDDYLRVDYGFSELIGGKGNDRIYASGPHNEVYAGEGNDYINSDYAAYIDAGKGNDTIYIYGDNLIYEGSVVYGGQGNDSISVSGSYNVIYGGYGEEDTPSGNDTIDLYTDAKYNTVYLEDGNDSIRLNGSYNTIYAGNGNDNITISHFDVINNLICGEGGNDIYNLEFYNYVSGNSSQNTIYDNSGNNSINFINYAGTKANLKMYINVYSDNSYDNDLIIYNDYNDKLAIQNYMTDGKIENIKSYDNYYVSDTVINNAVQQVASWLTTNSYDSVQQVLDSNNPTDINTVLAYFSNAWVSQ